MKVFTVQEISTTLKVSDDTILQLIKKEKLPAIKIGGQWRIEENAINAYIQSRATGRQKLKIA